MTLAHPNRSHRAPTAGSLDSDPAAEPVIKVDGDLDCFTAGRLTQAVTAVLGDWPRTLAVDLSAVSFLDSAGLGALIDSHRRAQAQGCELLLRGSRGVVRRVLNMTGVSNQVKLVDP